MVNFLNSGDLTCSNQVLSDCKVHECWDQVKKSSFYEERLKEVEIFNKDFRNGTIKRGLALIPVKFGIAFPDIYLNQGSALVHIYLDGSVLITHGGIEMGQGLFTKICQVASKALEIPIDRIHISETSTDKIPNAVASAASVGSDLQAAAVLVRVIYAFNFSVTTYDC